MAKMVKKFEGWRTQFLFSPGNPRRIQKHDHNHTRDDTKQPCA